MKNQQSFPSKWSIEVNKEVRQVVGKWLDTNHTNTGQQRGSKSFTYTDTSFEYFVYPDLDGSHIFNSNKGYLGYQPITLQQFKQHYLNQVDFTVPGTMLPELPGDTKFRVCCWSDSTQDDEFYSSRIGYKSFGSKVFKGETYVLCDRADYAGTNYYMVKLSDIQQLAKLQGISSNSNQTVMQNKTITATQAKQIIDIACDTWKGKLAKKWAANIVLEKSIDITPEFYIEMRKACTSAQNEVFDQIFGKDGGDLPTKFDDLGTVEGYYSNSCGEAVFTSSGSANDTAYHNTFPTKDQAAAVTSLAMLLQLRKAYIKDWTPDWTDGESKWCVIFNCGEIMVDNWASRQFVLSFPTKEMARTFAQNFKDLLLQAKPLLG